MNIWNHCRLSVRKFGGQPLDYFAIHKFMDSSKLFFYNPRHRLLLHHCWGIELAVQKFGDLLVNSDAATILVRDVAAAHCQEDLNGQVPTLAQWLAGNEALGELLPDPPAFEDAALQQLVLAPWHRAQCRAALLLTCSNFGVYLAQELLGPAAAQTLHQALAPEATVERYLSTFQFQARWQFTPLQSDLQWLRQQDALEQTT